MPAYADTAERGTLAGAGPRAPLGNEPRIEGFEENGASDRSGAKRDSMAEVADPVTQIIVLFSLALGVSPLPFEQTLPDSWYHSPVRSTVVVSPILVKYLRFCNSWVRRISSAKPEMIHEFATPFDKSSTFCDFQLFNVPHNRLIEISVLNTEGVFSKNAGFSSRFPGVITGDRSCVCSIEEPSAGPQLVDTDD